MSREPTSDCACRSLPLTRENHRGHEKGHGLTRHAKDHCCEGHCPRCERTEYLRQQEREMFAKQDRAQQAIWLARCGVKP